MQEIVTIKQLSHYFEQVQVFDNIDFNITQGEIFGLLGPSGAGKTTLINILIGQLKPTHGSTSLFGTLSMNMREEHFKQIGVMMDNFGLYERMSCYDNLKFYQMLDSGRKFTQKDSGNIEILLERVGLLSAKKIQVMHLSKGMKNRLAFARAILRNPEILFLDEPTSGLDPKTIEAIHQLILEEKRKGTTVFLTTHNMYEAQKLCDNIALLNNGRIVEYGNPVEICRRYNHQKKIHLHLVNGEDVILEHNNSCGEIISTYFAKGSVETIHSTEPNLETVFMELTGREIESNG